MSASAPSTAYCELWNANTRGDGMQQLASPRFLTSRQAKHVASELIRQHAKSQEFCARQVLHEHPELWSAKSAVLDLVCEDVSRRVGRGEAFDSRAFAARFPEYRSAVMDHIEVYRALAAALDATEPSWPVEGETFLGFTLLEEIGRGAFSRVFLASEIELGDRPVVLKVCAQADDEARLLGRLEHPGIVPIYAVRRDGPSRLACVVMPWCGRSTLRDVLDYRFARSDESSAGIEAAVQFFNESASIPVPHGAAWETKRSGSDDDVLLAIMLDVGRALQHAHNRGVIHADVKPSNVLVTTRLRGTVLDFNLSQELAVAGRFTGGTVTHMAPELLRLFAVGSPVVPTPASDVYAWGTMLCECFSASGPYGSIPTELTAPGLAQWCLQRHERGLLQIPATERGLEQMIRSCMAADPQARPQSMEEVCSRLSRELSGSMRLRRRIRSHRRVTTVLVTVAAAALAVQITQFTGRPPRHERLLLAAARAEAIGDFHRAISLLNEAERALPDTAPPQASMRILMTRGLARIDAGRFREAYGDLSQALRLDPASSVAAAWAAYSLSMATCLERDELPHLTFETDIETALQLYRRAELSSEMPSPALQFNIAHCLYLKRDRAAAEAVINQLIAEGHTLHNILHLKAVIDYGNPSANHVPESTWIESALKRAPPHSYWFDASCVYSRVAASRSGAEREAAVRRAVDCWELAVLHGSTKREAAQVGMWCDDVARNSRFQAATARASDASSNPPAAQFLEPFGRPTMVDGWLSPTARL